MAHKNLGKEKDVICVGGYPDGKDFDINYGRPGERPLTDGNIASLPIPKTDPLGGVDGTLPEIWNTIVRKSSTRNTMETSIINSN